MPVGKWDLGGVHGVRQYMWKLLQDELGWKASDYGGLTPITTPEQQPEFNNFNKPYIVYSYSKKQGTNNYFLEGEIATFVIYSSDSADIRRAINLFDAKLDKRDESAAEVNDFISASSLDPEYKYFDYKSLWVSMIQGPQPVTEEGGRRDGLINVNINYTHYGPDGKAIRF